MKRIHLRDVDNRDAEGTPFEFSGGIEKAIKYLDNVVRRDIKGHDGALLRLESALTLLMRGDVAEANEVTSYWLGIYLRETE